MIYKLNGEGYAGEQTSVEFELIDGKVCISFETNESSGMFANVDAADLNNLLGKIKPKCSSDIDKVWVIPMSKAIHEILEGNGLTVFGEYNMDELTFDSITLEILELFEAFIITGGVQIPEYKDGKKVR